MATLSASTYCARAQRRTSGQHFRLDMTPMVDLAFVLLTFFMVTVQPPVLQLTMPELPRPGYYVEYCGRHHGFQVATIVLGQNHQLHYYVGYYGVYGPEGPRPVVHTSDFSSQGIRHQLLAWRSQLPKLPILIKPGPQATYRDMVEILDEMIITDQSRYVLMNLSAADRQLLLANGKQ
jgi:biopolymer transport protein ExbD